MAIPAVGLLAIGAIALVGGTLSAILCALRQEEREGEDKPLGKYPPSFIPKPLPDDDPSG